MQDRRFRTTVVSVADWHWIRVLLTCRAHRCLLAGNDAFLLLPLPAQTPLLVQPHAASFCSGAERRNAMQMSPVPFSPSVRCFAQRAGWR